MPRAALSRVVAALALLVLAACTGNVPPPSSGPALSAVSFADLPGWSSDAHSAALTAFRRSCEAILKLPADRPLAEGRAGRAGHWRPGCFAAAQVPAGNDSAARAFFENYFRPYRVTNDGRDEGIFTGYYEPELHASKTRQGRFTHPLYAKPADLDPNKPYFDRAEIEAGKLKDRNLELLWADDPIDVFFLQIQGSGRAVLPDGQVQQVGFAAHNGRPYTAVGRILADRGDLPADGVSMQSIRAWMTAHADQAPALMRQNQRYVFFRLIQGDGPIGAEGVALTPGRSLAVDPAFVPYGAPLWLDATEPADHKTPFRRLVIAQDTGVAVKGAISGDVFWGAGAEAIERAGKMRERGRYFLLLPREIDPIPRS